MHTRSESELRPTWWSATAAGGLAPAADGVSEAASEWISDD